MTTDPRYRIGGRLVLALERPTEAARARAIRAVGATPAVELGVPDLVVRWAPGVGAPRISGWGHPDEPVTLTFDGRDDGAPSVLRAVALALLAERDAIPLHAATGSWCGSLVAVAGPPGAGKTTMLLAAVAQGLRPVASEWILIEADRVTALEHAIRVRGHHLLEIPGIDRAIPRTSRVALRALERTARVATGLGASIGRRGRNAAAAGALDRLGSSLRRRTYVDVPIAAFWPDQPRRPGDPEALDGGLDALVLLSTSSRGRPRIDPVDPAEAAATVGTWMAHDMEPLARVTLEGSRARIDLSDGLRGYDVRLGQRLKNTRCLKLVRGSDPDPADEAAAILGRLPS